ncbi:MAG TPA: excinuclease ABC subunit UvrC [Paludibacteraceae bacterium]|nr:excinuclease ABC subunit UvrC [Paludibacteraceae bacterium]HOJ65447.1 excinuclease ABC subunit UvrC [Paludibacteraceae bacterium]HOL28891.1 excinuclease ABC subunit UvrC [Paludibacteraceae bacterium]HON02011.1 excinuclease ABC subunit UvrC [Paludibacteraceae bacterium]HPD59373.1 excinuclease ABC subunit UvrC [Paludibacteraceae bacterium]
MNLHPQLKQQIDALPEKPGVYQYFNEKEEIIYVGKAKNLKKRVSSYFTKTHESRKTAVLVRNISSLKYIVVDTEEDALLLENNLIKKFQPRYNVLLKDGKTYPSICITNEEFPRVFKTRNIIKNGSLYFGPYSSSYTINSLLEIIHDLYPIRTCKLQLTDENIKAGKFKVCLQYHIHKCNGPCEGKESAEIYRKYINEIKQIIEGNANEISKMLWEEMQKLSAAYKFEEAYQIKQKYDLIENYKSKSIIANSVVENTDVFGYEETENAAYINILRISKGSIIQGYTIEYQKHVDEEKEDLLAMAIVELRERLKSNSKEIVVPFEINYKPNGVSIVIPQRGDRKKLLDLAQQNVLQYKFEKLKQAEKLNPDQRSMQLLKEIQEKLHLEKLPITIECFDNSNIQGKDAVAACVVFKKGRPSKKDYRKYNIKTVVGPDDYASMKEVVKRRYSRMIAENGELPDLIIADGGIGQMEVIREVVEDELNLRIPIIGLAKDSKHHTREILFGFPPKNIGMTPNEPLFKLLATMQEEVHRFAIKFHREKRSKNQTTSELDNIKGIGDKTKRELINHFKSIKRLQNANLEDIQKVVGNHRASIVYGYFHKDLSAPESQISK